MVDLEIKVDRLDERVSSLEQRVTETTANVNSLIRELKDFKDEMRDRDNQRAKEIQDMRQKHDADMKEIRASIDSMGKHVRNMSVAAMAGVGGMFIAVGVMVATMIYTLLSR